MSKSRWGGFRIGKRVFTDWENRKSPSTNLIAPPETIQEFDYTTAQGIWNLRSTTQFSKKTASTPVLLSYINAYGINSSTSTYNFTIASTGPGLVVVSVHSESGANTSRAPTGVTIGGVSATQAVVSAVGASGGSPATAIWYAVIESSTTAISVIYGSSPLRCGIGVYTISNYSSATPSFTGSDGSSALAQVRTVNTTAISGAIIAAAVSGDQYAHTWTGVTENYDQQIAGGLSGMTGASLVTTTVQPYTISSSTGGTPAQGTNMVVAVWS